MDTMLQNFHFLRPWFLLLILPVLFMYGRYLKSGSTKSSWQKVIDKKLLNFLLIKGSSQRRNFYSIATILGMMAAIIAVSGPSFQKIEVPALTPQNPVMIALNLSSDMQETDLPPNRLSRAKYKIADFLSMLQGVQTGLEVYSGEPFIISPLSDDANIIKNLLPAIDLSLMPTNGDRLDRAIDLAINKIKSASYDKGRIIVFTPDVGQGFDKALASAEKAKQQGFIIDIIGVTAKYNEKLALVAEKGGGKYWNLQADDTRISQLASAINRTGGELTQGQNLRTIWLDAGWYLLAVPMLYCLLFFRKGLLLWLLIASFDAKAGFFLNADQEGIKSFNNGEYTAAAEQFNDNQWKAASFYRMGDFAKAAELYREDTTVTGLYNQGNALAKSGKIADAIKRYEEVLRLSPDHEDAKFNLEYLKKQQNQQQNRQNKEDNRQDEKDQSRQDQDKQQSNNASDNPKDAKQDKKQNDDSQDRQSSQQQTNSDRQDNKADKEKQNQSNAAEQKTTKQNEQSREGSAFDKGAPEEKYDEQMQAKAQQYREIPEDPGGLLKAFINQEYRQNRYNEQ